MYMRAEPAGPTSNVPTVKAVAKQGIDELDIEI
jgi:hypothetical protein